MKMATQQLSRIATNNAELISGRRTRLFARIGYGRIGSRKHAYVAAHAPLILEANNSRNAGKQSVVLTFADVQARLVPGASLANQDCPGINQLAGKSLAAQPLSGGIAAIY